MNEQRGGAGLSTADMVAGMEQREGNAAVSDPQRSSNGFAAPEQQTAEPERSTANGGAAATTADSGEHTPLLTEDKATDFRSRWDSVQASFVDEPRQAVEQADSLVAEAIKHLAEVFAQERSKLE
jgi:hypothetical protein